MRDLQNDQEQGAEQFAGNFPTWVDDRNERLNVVNDAFTQRAGTSYGDYVTQQKASALSVEQNLSAATRANLDAARAAAFNSMQTTSQALANDPGAVAAFEAPLRVTLNPELTNPDNFARLTPPSAAGSAPPVVTTPGSGFVGAQSTFPTLTRAQALRQQLETERQKALALDRTEQARALASAGLQGVVAGGGIAAKAAGGVIGGYVGQPAAGAAIAGTAYSIITAAPDVILGNKTLSQAAANVATGVVVSTATGGLARGLGGSMVDSAAAGTAASTVVQATIDWVHPFRMIGVSGTR